MRAVDRQMIPFSKDNRKGFGRKHECRFSWWWTATAGLLLRDVKLAVDKIFVPEERCQKRALAHGILPNQRWKFYIGGEHCPAPLLVTHSDFCIFRTTIGRWPARGVNAGKITKILSRKRDADGFPAFTVADRWPVQRFSVIGPDAKVPILFARIKNVSSLQLNWQQISGSSFCCFVRISLLKKHC